MILVHYWALLFPHQIERYTRQRPKSKSIFSFFFFFFCSIRLCGDNFVRDFLKHILYVWVTFIVKNIWVKQSHADSKFPILYFASPPHALIFIYFPFNLFWRNFSYIVHEKAKKREKCTKNFESFRSLSVQFQNEKKISNVNQRIKTRLRRWKKKREANQ